MKILRRHKGLAIIGGLSLILLAVIFAIFSRMIFSTGKGEYGDRLNDIVSVPKETFNKVKEQVKANEGVTDVTTRIQGKIIYTIISFDTETNKEKAKEIATKTLELYDEDVIKCYDFEFLLNQKEIKDEEGNDISFAVAGTKHPENESITWTRN